MLLQTTTGSAEALLRDVLELRHRLPLHWDGVLTGRIEGWKARQVAKATRRLTLEQALKIDAMVVDAVVGLSWGKAKDVVEAKVIAVDAEGHRARLEEEENRRFVSTRRRSNAAGLRTVVARCHAGEVARLEAMISHLAERLEQAGSTDGIDARRATALAMLANPALTCVFLSTAHEAPAPSADPPTDLELPIDEHQEMGSASAAEVAEVFGRVLRELGAKAIQRLRPRSVLYLHLSAEAVQGQPDCGVARVDDPVAGGPIDVEQLRAWLANDRVTVKPVIDPLEAQPVSSYEIPAHLREAMELLVPCEVFPYGTAAARESDQDHSVAYVPICEGGPPLQTALTNLGPLGRRHHLAKTFGRFRVHQPTLGLYLWRSPTGHWFRVDERGTVYLGKQQPPAVELGSRHDRAQMTTVEASFRDQLVRHVAA
jgi:hypothetical protein